MQPILPLTDSARRLPTFTESVSNAWSCSARARGWLYTGALSYNEYLNTAETLVQYGLASLKKVILPIPGATYSVANAFSIHFPEDKSYAGCKNFT